MSVLSDQLGKPIARVDGIAKVTGAARYASDEPVPHPAFAYLVTSRIARGRIRAFDLTEARAVPGVIDIVTYENVGGGFDPAKGPDGGPTTTTLESNQIWHDGQIIGIVVAETYEAAREAAHKSKVSYEEETPSASFDSPGVTTEPHKTERGPDPSKGDAEQAYAQAPVKFEADYSTPTQHHNPIELFTITCEWKDGKLTIYEPSQFMWGTKASAAKQLKLDPDQVRAFPATSAVLLAPRAPIPARTGSRASPSGSADPSNSSPRAIRVLRSQRTVPRRATTSSSAPRPRADCCPCRTRAGK